MKSSQDRTAFLSQWLDYVRDVARRLAPALTRYGWDGDDAAQHAALKLVKVGDRPRLHRMTDECLRKYLPKLIRRSVFRAAARPKHLLLPAEDAVLALAEARGDGFAAEFLTEVLADAPAAVREYLDVVIVRGEFWRGARTTKARAAAWVERQLGVV